MNDHRLRRLRDRLAMPRQALLTHPIYEQVTTVDRLRAFMETHVFAVWDFMSLLKALQQQLTCVSIPWLPPRDRAACRLINEIVLGEESDDDGRGGSASHFELYLEAMTDCGADTRPILEFCERLRHGEPLELALKGAQVNKMASEFVTTTFVVILSKRPSSMAAALTFGREEVIPDMFQRFVSSLCAESPAQFARFRFYLDRHIELDSDSHGPKALQMVDSICGEDEAEWSAAEKAAMDAIQARRKLWDELSAHLVRLPER